MIAILIASGAALGPICDGHALARPLRIICSDCLPSASREAHKVRLSRARLRDLLERYDLQVHAISAHLVGQAVLDPIDERHQAILPAHVWGDGKPAGVNARAAEELKKTARAAQRLGVPIVNGFTGSSIW